MKREIIHYCEKKSCNRKAIFKIRIKSEKINKKDNHKGFSKEMGTFCVKHSREFKK